ncbi:MAG: hypothetical protein PHV74_08325 [Dehalococcoidia bacterium]|nr:hypothetical protein [Dehalococcoidia bacterium]
MRYQTQEWVDAITEKSRTDQEYLKKAKTLTAKQRSIIMDAPGGVDILLIWEWNEGKVVKTIRQEKPAPSEWRNLKNEEGLISTTLGTYENLSKVARGEVTSQEAMAKKLYILHGDMIKVFPKMAGFNAFGQLVASVKCDY